MNTSISEANFAARRLVELQADMDWEKALLADALKLRRETLLDCEDPYFVVPASLELDDTDQGFAWGFGDYRHDQTYATEDEAWAACWEDAKATVLRISGLPPSYFNGMSLHREIEAVDNHLNPLFG